VQSYESDQCSWNDEHVQRKKIARVLAPAMIGPPNIIFTMLPPRMGTLLAMEAPIPIPNMHLDRSAAPVR